VYIWCTNHLYRNNRTYLLAQTLYTCHIFTIATVQHAHKQSVVYLRPSVKCADNTSSMVLLHVWWKGFARDFLIISVFLWSLFLTKQCLSQAAAVVSITAFSFVHCNFCDSNLHRISLNDLLFETFLRQLCDKQTYWCTYHSAATLVTAVDQNICEAINNVYTAEIPTESS